MTKLKLILASIALIGLSATAFAHGGKKLDPAQKAKVVEMRKAKRAAMLAKFDANKDGSLDRAEKTAMREQRIEKRFAKLDANADGVITLAEMKAAKHGGRRGPKLVK